MQRLPLVRSGDVFGFWTVGHLPRPVSGRQKVPCICRCGTRRSVEIYSLLRGLSRSCRCRLTTTEHREKLRALATTHGMSRLPIYKVWTGMIYRVDGAADEYIRSRYTDRGIGVSKAWRTFENFYRDMGDQPFPGASLDRKNNDKGYSKRNCRWATPAEQGANRSNTRLITYKGETKSLNAWATHLSLSRSCLSDRLQTMTVNEAFTKPSRKGKHK